MQYNRTLHAATAGVMRRTDRREQAEQGGDGFSRSNKAGVMPRPARRNVLAAARAWAGDACNLSWARDDLTRLVLCEFGAGQGQGRIT